MCKPSKRAWNIIQNSYRFNVLTMIQFSHVLHHVFVGWPVVENNTKHYMSFITLRIYETTPKTVVVVRRLRNVVI